MSVAAEQKLAIRWWREKPVWIMLFLGFSAGIPILLIFSSLSLWLREAGVERSTVTYFSWAVLGYSFKFLWAPLVDKIPIPLLTSLLGRRRSWLLLSQFAIMASIVLMAFTDPQNGLRAMAIAAILLGFASATHDVALDAFRIESASPRLQAMLSSTYIAGYRTGMIVAGAGALYLAEGFGSSKEIYSYLAWKKTYLIMATTILVGVLTTLIISEPESVDKKYDFEPQDYLRFLLTFVGSIVAFVLVFSNLPKVPELFSGGIQKLFSFVVHGVEFIIALVAAFLTAVLFTRAGFVNKNLVNQGYVEPTKDFFARYGKLAVWVLLLVGFYRISDIVLGVITNVFYQDMGYSKSEIATVSKFFGVFMTISGSFLGGIIALRIGVMRALLIAAILVVITNLLFIWLTNIGSNFSYWTLPLVDAQMPKELTIVIIFDNLVQGMSLAAFIAWLSSLTNVSFTATQYAIFSSLMTLFPKFLGGYSGSLVDTFGYSNFFLFSSAIGIPVIVLIIYLSKKLEFNKAISP